MAIIVDKKKLNTYEVVVRKNLMFGRKIEMGIIYTDHNGKEFIITDFIKEEMKDYLTVTKERSFMSEESVQQLINELYNIGYRPSDDVRKDDLIKFMQSEIEKRDKTINSLMERFVYKTSDFNVQRKITP